MIITRWIWGPTETINGQIKPICREYAVKWDMPHLNIEGWGLTLCELTPTHWEAAKLDDTIIIMPSLYSQEPIDMHVAEALEKWGIVVGMSAFELLIQLGEKCSIRFLPSL